MMASTVKNGNDRLRKGNRQRRPRETSAVLSGYLQFRVLQLSVLVLGPGHFLPLPEGGGLVQVRFLTRTPPPQVLSQGPGLLQGDQLPSTPRFKQTDKPKPVITNSEYLPFDR